jgi:hypothetical protein
VPAAPLQTAVAVNAADDNSQTLVKHGQRMCLELQQETASLSAFAHSTTAKWCSALEAAVNNDDFQ